MIINGRKVDTYYPELTIEEILQLICTGIVYPQLLTEDEMDILYHINYGEFEIIESNKK